MIICCVSALFVSNVRVLPDGECRETLQGCLFANKGISLFRITQIFVVFVGEDDQEEEGKSDPDANREDSGYYYLTKELNTYYQLT